MLILEFYKSISNRFISCNNNEGIDSKVDTPSMHGDNYLEYVWFLSPSSDNRNQLFNNLDSLQNTNDLCHIQPIMYVAKY